MPYTIEHDVPLTPPATPARASKYPLREMEVGDSFVIPILDNSSIGVRKVRRNIASTASRWGVSIACRRVDGGLRVWRVS